MQLDLLQLQVPRHTQLVNVRDRLNDQRRHLNIPIDLNRATATIGTW
jgi:hypothetical protein